MVERATYHSWRVLLLLLGNSSHEVGPLLKGRGLSLSLTDAVGSLLSVSHFLALALAPAQAQEEQSPGSQTCAPALRPSASQTCGSV